MTTDQNAAFPGPTPLAVRFSERMHRAVVTVTLLFGVLFLIGGLMSWPMIPVGVAALVLAWFTVRDRNVADRFEGAAHERLRLRSSLWLLYFWIGLFGFTAWGACLMQTATFPSARAVQTTKPARITIEPAAAHPEVWRMKVWLRPGVGLPATYECGKVLSNRVRPCDRPSAWENAASRLSEGHVDLIVQTRKVVSARVGGETLVDLKAEAEKYHASGRFMVAVCTPFLIGLGAWAAMLVLRLRRLRWEAGDLNGS